MLVHIYITGSYLFFNDRVLSFRGSQFYIFVIQKVHFNFNLHKDTRYSGHVIQSLRDSLDPV